MNQIYAIYYGNDMKEKYFINKEGKIAISLIIPMILVLQKLMYISSIIAILQVKNNEAHCSAEASNLQAITCLL